MKRLMMIPAVLALAVCNAFAGDVGVSISVGQPGFYGQINIGDFPPPVVVNRQPIIIDRGPVLVESAPIYLRVPPGHQKDWRMYCREYNACGRPVYFVQDRWYNEVYVAQYRERHGERDRRSDARREHERGRGYDRGKGHRD